MAATNWICSEACPSMHPALPPSMPVNAGCHASRPGGARTRICPPHRRSICATNRDKLPSSGPGGRGSAISCPQRLCFCFTRRSPLQHASTHHCGAVALKNRSLDMRGIAEDGCRDGTPCTTVCSACYVLRVLCVPHACSGALAASPSTSVLQSSAAAAVPVDLSTASQLRGPRPRNSSTSHGRIPYWQAMQKQHVSPRTPQTQAAFLCALL